jgi:hypothetical protein
MKSSGNPSNCVPAVRYCPRRKSSLLREGTQLSCRSALYLAQALIEAQLPKPPPLYLVTRGVATVRGEQAAGRSIVTGDPLPHGVVQAPVWGLGKVLTSEHRELQCLLMDLDPARGLENASIVFDELWWRAEPDENRVAIRGGRRYVACLARSRACVAPHPLRVHANRSYLITGGLGEIGLRVSRWLVEQGARHLVLVGRRGGSQAAKDTVREFQQAGVRVLSARVDVSQPDQVSELLAEIARQLPPLAGVIHAAGVFADRLIVDQQWHLFEEVFAPKVDGAWNLHGLTKGHWFRSIPNAWDGEDFCQG